MAIESLISEPAASRFTNGRGSWVTDDADGQARLKRAVGNSTDDAKMSMSLLASQHIDGEDQVIWNFFSQLETKTKRAL